MKPVQLDLSTLEKKKAFFKSNNGLSTYDLAMLARKSPSTIRNWKRQTGQVLKPSPFTGLAPAPKRRQVEIITNQAVWDNADWFRQKYVVEKFGTPTIARMIRRSTVLVVKRLGRYKIDLRSHKEAVKPKSKYYDATWLREHYVVKKWSLKRCAKVAGVVPYTIYNWLINFDIVPRSPQEAMSGALNPFFGKKHSERTKEKIRQAIKRRQAEKKDD